MDGQKIKNHQSRIKKSLLALIALAALLPAGCDRVGQRAAAPGAVKANAAFLDHFGEPPVPEQGTCFARVGYFPLARDPARGRAVPLFLFRESGQLPLLLDRLLDRDWEFPPSSGLLHPFPPGSRLLITEQAGDTITIDLHLPAAAEKMEPAAMIGPLVETALQFEELERVFVTLAGVPLAGTPAGGFRHDPRRIAPAGPPLPLMVVGSWEEGDEDPEEILVNFDRPVTVHEIRLLDAAGREIRGDFFRAGFDMAVVVHPAEPRSVRAGMTVRVAWRVTDRLGRTGSGEQSFVLERHDHDHGPPLPAAAGEGP
jgi:germination protein M